MKNSKKNLAEHSALASQYNIRNLFAKKTSAVMNGGVLMNKQYIIPSVIVDPKEEKSLITLTEAYNKMVEPNVVGKTISKIGQKIPEPIKEFVDSKKEKLSEAELLVKSLEILGKGFQTIEQFASKVTLSEKEIIKRANSLNPDNPISTLDELCLLRSYDISKLVNKNKFVDIIVTAIEGAATGAPGFAGIPFNLVLSTFLFYRAVQSIALFYGYDIKNDPAELQIATEVFINAINPRTKNSGEISNVIAKIMLFSTATSIKQTVKKGWTAMAEKGGIHLLLVQLRALAHKSAKKALAKAGKKGLEETAFTELFEQIGKKITQKSLGKVMPYIGAIIGATIDTAQMIQIIKYADIFYCKRFILEKESRINLLIESNVQLNPAIIESDVISEDTDE